MIKRNLKKMLSELCGMYDARYLIPGYFPPFGVNDFHIGIVTGASDWRNAAMKLFQVAAPHAGSGHKFGKLALGFRRVTAHKLLTVRRTA